MDASLKGKCALVTGAGRGIGRAVAKALAATGAEIVAVDKGKADLDSLQSEHSNITTICVDLRDWDKTKAAVESAGPIDLLVNNAGVGIMNPFLEATQEDFDITFDINVKACINVAQVVAKGLIARGKSGSIVNVSSQASKIAIHEHAVYNGSKGALDQITKVMALELGPHQIRVNTVNPTVVKTELGMAVWCASEKTSQALAKIPLGKFAETKDVVGPILFLLSDQSAMINGANLMVDGGWSIW